MSSDDGFEHWPRESARSARPPVATQAHDGFQYYTCYPVLPTTLNPAAAASQQLQPLHHSQQSNVQSYPQPMYLAEPKMPQPQYYTPQQTTYVNRPHQRTYNGEAKPARNPKPSKESTPEQDDSVYVYRPQYERKAKNEEVWVGRTKKLVDEDNMRIAAEQGAYAKRKIQPVDVNDDQVFWVVDVDGLTGLRTFVDIQEMKGEWMLDPRFKKAYYFVCER